MASELLFRTMEQNKIETDKKTLTIFTPTYNRAYTLHLGYEALSADLQRFHLADCG